MKRYRIHCTNRPPSLSSMSSLQNTTAATPVFKIPGVTLLPRWLSTQGIQIRQVVLTLRREVGKRLKLKDGLPRMLYELLHGEPGMSRRRTLYHFIKSTDFSPKAIDLASSPAPVARCEVRTCRSESFNWVADCEALLSML